MYSTDDEITARFSVGELAEAPEEFLKEAPDIQVQVTFGARTDLGRVRDNNEDKFDYLVPDDPELLANNGSLYAVADGMGGHAAGQIASEMALKALLRSYYSRTSYQVEARLRRAINEANSLVHDAARAIPDRSGMGTTVVLTVVREDDLFIAHVGDSRAYLIRNGEISRLTRDHSWVEEQVARGALTEEEAVRSPFKNVITRSLGVQPTVEPDISTLKLEVGDRILLCSDGLTGHLNAPDLLKIASQGSPSQVTWELVEAANERGGQDNITAFLLRIDQLNGKSESNTDLDTSDELGDNRAGETSNGWISRFLKR